MPKIFFFFQKNCQKFSFFYKISNGIFFEKMSSFWPFFDIQMAIFRRVRPRRTLEFVSNKCHVLFMFKANPQCNYPFAMTDIALNNVMKIMDSISRLSTCLKPRTIHKYDNRTNHRSWRSPRPANTIGWIWYTRDTICSILTTSVSSTNHDGATPVNFGDCPIIL